MIELGLLDEIKELRQIADNAAQSTSPNPHNDYTLGIYQAIGEEKPPHFHDKGERASLTTCTLRHNRLQRIPRLPQRPHVYRPPRIQRRC